MGTGRGGTGLDRKDTPPHAQSGEVSQPVPHHSTAGKFFWRPRRRRKTLTQRVDAPETWEGRGGGGNGPTPSPPPIRCRVSRTALGRWGTDERDSTGLQGSRVVTFAGRGRGGRALWLGTGRSPLTTPHPSLLTSPSRGGGVSYH